MEFLGTPDKIIAGFGPELFGGPLYDDDVLDTKVYKKGNDTYYQWDLKPHRKVVATATGNRVRILNCWWQLKPPEPSILAVPGYFNLTIASSNRKKRHCKAAPVYSVCWM